MFTKVHHVTYVVESIESAHGIYFQLAEGELA